MLFSEEEIDLLKLSIVRDIIIIIEQINSNEFRVNDRLKNTFLWLLDQLEYTGVGKQFPDALIICKIAARGQQAYDRTRRSNFNQLFSIGETK